MKKQIYLILQLLLSMSTQQADAYIRNNGIGLSYTTSALIIPKGTFALTSYSRFFFKDRVHTLVSGDQRGVTIWDIQSGTALSYGYSEKLEFTFSQVLYQDTNIYGKGYNLPGDIFLSGKYNAYYLPLRGINLAFQGMMRFPVGQYHNIPFEPYSAGRIEICSKGILSWYSDPNFPYTGSNLLVNLDLLCHNDSNKPLANNPSDPGTKTTAFQMLYGIGYAKYSGEFAVFLELHGNLFLQKPAKNAYSREAAIYLTPTVEFMPNRWLALSVGADFLIGPNNDETAYIYGVGRKGDDVPNYPNWRLHFSMRFAAARKYQTIQSDMVDTDMEISVVDEIETRDAEVFEKLAHERKKTEMAEEQLDRIRKERERMEQMLERLRSILEWNNKQPAKKEKE